MSYIRDTGEFKNGSGTPASGSFAAAASAGNVIILLVSASGSAAITASDAQGAYTSAFQAATADGIGRVGILYRNVITAPGSPLTVSVAQAGSAAITAIAFEYSGVVTSSAVDQTASDAPVSGNAATTLTTTSTTATLAQASELAVAITATGNFFQNPNSITPSAGWTQILSETNDASAQCGAAAYQVLSSTAAISNTWTWALPTGNTNNTVASAIVTFKLAAATVTGSGAAQDSADTAVGAGTVGSPDTGSGAASDAKDTASGAGAVNDAGAGAAQDATDAVSASGTVGSGGGTTPTIRQWLTIDNGQTPGLGGIFPGGSYSAALGGMNALIGGSRGFGVPTLPGSLLVLILSFADYGGSHTLPGGISDSTGNLWTCLVTGTGYKNTDTVSVATSSIGGTGSGFSVPVAAVGALGDIHTLGTISGGSGYTNGNYYNVPLTGGSGIGATATIVVRSGAVAAVFLELEADVPNAVYGGGLDAQAASIYYCQGANALSVASVITSANCDDYDAFQLIEITGAATSTPLYIANTQQAVGAGTNTVTSRSLSAPGPGLLFGLSYNASANTVQQPATGSGATAVGGAWPFQGTNGRLAGTKIATGGTGYNGGSGSGTFTNIALTGGHGTGGVASVTVTSGVITACTVTTSGNGYQQGDVLSVGTVGAAGGSSFQLVVRAVDVATVTNPLVNCEYTTVSGAGPVALTWSPGGTSETYLSAAIFVANGSGGSTDSGLGAAQDGADTVAGSGTTTAADSGAGAAQDGFDVATGAGQAFDAGSGAIAEQSDAASAAGQVATSGAGAVADQADVAAAVGGQGAVGSGAAINGQDTAAGSGVLSDAGAGIAQDRPDSAQAAGSLGGLVVGTGAAQDATDAATGAAGLGVAGAGSAADAIDAVAGSGATVNAGAGAAVDQPDIASGSSLSMALVIGAVSELPDTTIGVGQLAVAAIGAVAEQQDQAAGAAAVIFNAALSGAVADQADLVTGIAAQINAGIGAVYDGADSVFSTPFRTGGHRIEVAARNRVAVITGR